MGNREWGIGNWQEGNYPFPITHYPKKSDRYSDAIAFNNLSFCYKLACREPKVVAKMTNTRLKKPV